jgi:hypothetical protein
MEKEILNETKVKLYDYLIKLRKEAKVIEEFEIIRKIKEFMEKL